ncbi:hypothetical protein [Bradyrhizobium sp. dw_78]|uniref:hypothetical protein n=1 Tax=Bradyrhizobium sp. dw_78 TaxID=2719793 RepID=UPI001BD427FC|nr:hypothetical protein [Bradyrhizobium sp. dw_78]
MANDAFALSPISARAAQPSDEDYEAISEAFMETSRGRWFLGEYAKRNRNADTGMVLDAVVRIEQSLAAQKQQGADSKLADALSAIRAALDGARAAASASFDSFALEQNLAPVRKGARVIKEISWRWREIGADSRICDLIDSQIAAIEASCLYLSSIEPKAALNAAFDLVDRRLTAFDGRTGAPPEAAKHGKATAEAAPPPSSAPSPVATGEASAEAEASVAAAETVSGTPLETAEIGESAVAATDSAAAAEPVTESVEVSAEAADADDEALLDMIALEMSVVDASDDEEEQSAETPAAYPSPADHSPTMSEVIAYAAELPTIQEMTAAMEPSPPPLQPALEPVGERTPEFQVQAAAHPSPEPSLGAALVASGIVRKPISATDPLAPLRRMSQAEKIALFS